MHSDVREFRIFLLSSGRVGEFSDVSLACRKHRSCSLRCLSEFEELETELAKCKSKAHLQDIMTRWRPFKQALADIGTMSKGAATRATAALKKIKDPPQCICRLRKGARVSQPQKCTVFSVNMLPICVVLCQALLVSQKSDRVMKC